MLTDAVTRLRAQPLFAELGPATLLALGEHGRPAAFPAGRRIFDEDGPADRFWLLETGRVALDLHVPGREPQIVETIGAGAVLGWSWLQPPYRWHFGAVVLAGADAVEFDAGAVRRGAEADPAFGYAIMKLFLPIVTERLQAARLRLIDLWGAPTGRTRS
jgi:CRP-like cAMP-binding protein